MLRGAFPLQGKLHASALELLKVVYPLNTVDLAAAAPHNIASTLAPVFEPQIFAMSANTVFSQAEKGHLGCVRIHVKGTKSIIATPEEALLAYMTARAPGTHPTFPELWQFFKTMTKEALNNYVDAQGKNKLFGCTASAGDIVYTPPCYAIAERALGGPCLGIKYTVMSKGDDVQLEKVYKELTKRNRHANSSGELIKSAIEICRLDVAAATAPPAPHGALAEAAAAEGTEAKALKATAEAEALKATAEAEAEALKASGA